MRGKLILIFCFSFWAVHAQISPVEQAIEYLVEFGQTEGQEPDLVQIAEELSYLQNNPIPVNSATADELAELPLFNSFLVFNLLDYRNRTGNLVSIYQLADVKGFTPRFVAIISPFITLEIAAKTRLIPRRYNHQLTLRYRQLFQQSEGLRQSAYPGHISENYLRYRLQGDGKLFAGITAQRDPGESWGSSGYSPDFLSFHAEYRLNKTVKNIVLGDFSAEFGQGLTMWSSLAFNKSAEGVSVARFGRGLRHYTGTDENRFLRGLGTTVALGPFQVAAFYSSNKADANLVEGKNGQLVASSLQSSGFHRTTSELDDKNAQRIQISGLHAEWRPTRLRIGLTAMHTQFKYALQPLDRPANAQRFRGDELLHTSLDWKWLYNGLYFFGETGFEWLNQRAAVTAGLQAQASDALQWVVQYRYLQNGWFSAFNAPFSETGRDGEQGIYVGLSWQLPSYLKLTAFADHFQYLWLRSNLNQLGQGADYMVQLNYLPLNFNSYVRIRYQIRPQNISSDLPIREGAPVNRLSVRWHNVLPVTQSFSIQLRAEWVQVIQQQREIGLLLFAGFSYSINEKWRIKARYSLFDTESFSSAIWAYEDDVPYSYTVPAYFENGTKWYAVITYQLSTNKEIWLRLADTFYLNLETLGSGLDQLATNRRTELKVLLRFNF